MTYHLRLLIVIIISIVFNNPVFCQNINTENDDEGWLKGYVYLTSGEKIKGELGYFFLNQTIQTKMNGSVISYNTKKVDRFTIYKSDNEKLDFVCFPVSTARMVDINNLQTRNKATNEEYRFLYIQYKNQNFAILSNLNYDQEVYNYSDNNLGNRSAYIGALVERVYILDKRATPFPILSRTINKNSNPKKGINYYKRNFGISNSDSGFTNFTFKQQNPKFNLINKDFLEELDPRNHKKLQAYIDNNDIDIKTIEGLTQLIDYWAEI